MSWADYGSNFTGFTGASGGGTASSLTFPNATGTDTTTGMYRHWIVDDLDGMITAAKAADSPYYGETVPDPDTYMDGGATTRTQKEVTDQFSLVEGIDEDDDYRRFIEQSVAEVDESDTFPSITTDVESIHTSERTSISSALSAALTAAASAVEDSPIADLVVAYESRIKKQYLRAMSRHAAYMSDIGAVNSTAFGFGMAAIDRQMLEDIDGYASGLDMQTYQLYMNLYMQTFTETFRSHLSGDVRRKASRDLAVMQAASDMANLYMYKVSANHNVTSLQAEVNRTRYVAKSEEFRDQLSLEVHDTLWDFELYAYGGNMLATAGGAAMTPPNMSKSASTLSGALAGASVGALLSPVGAGIGAIAGAILSGF